MPRPIVSLAFTKASNADLLVKTDLIIASMTGNTHYPIPSPTLAAVQTAQTAFNDAVTEAADGGKTLTAQKNAARAVLLDLLRNLALYVQQHCQNDLAILLSSGFDARKTPARAGVLPAPGYLFVTQGVLAGSLYVRCKPVANVSSYEAQLSTDISKEDHWEDQGTFSSSRFDFVNLTPGTTYWVRVRAVGAAGPGAWSDAISAMVI